MLIYKTSQVYYTTDIVWLKYISDCAEEIVEPVLKIYSVVESSFSKITGFK